MPQTSKQHDAATRLLDRYSKLILVVSGVAVGSVFSFNLSAWLQPLLLLPFIALLYKPDNRSTLRRYISSCALFFIPFHATVFVWFLDANLPGLIDVSPRITTIALGTCLAIMAIVLSLAMLPIAYVAYASAFRKPTARLVLLPAAWVVCEWLRSILFSVFLYGNQGSVGDYWNFGSLGLELMDTPAKIMAPVVGMYGLTFITVILSVILYNYFTKANSRYTLHTLSVLGLVIFFSVIWQINLNSQPSNQRSASVLQQRDSVPKSGTNFIIDNFSTEAKDIIVLPEYSDFFELGYTQYAQDYIDNRLAPNGVGITVEADWLNQNNRYGTLIFRNDQKEIVATQTKKLLIPTGEYMPYILTNFFKLIGKNELNTEYAETRQLLKGTDPAVFKTKDLVIAPVACSGILGRNIYRQLVNDGGQVLTNSASLVVFNGSKSYFKQSLQMARFHAIANNRTYIQASKGAPAFVIDDNGNYIVKPGNVEDKFIDFNFAATDKKTFYTNYGEWPLILSSLLIIISVGRNFKTRTKNRRYS
ncbi:hypothetical protein H0X10_00975 [Candidatus Saccharibacteria bacterium]|nr:hypothetical protein [Candidatus Saccharibacteria bacterium]